MSGEAGGLVLLPLEEQFWSVGLLSPEELLQLMREQMRLPDVQRHAGENVRK